MEKFLKYLSLFPFMLPLSCSGIADPEPYRSGDCICFMVVAEPMTKGEISAVADIGTLYVTETMNNKFNSTSLAVSNGMCSTDVPWTSGAYSFFGYVKSNGRGSIYYDEVENGRSFTVTQPESDATGDIPSTDGTNRDFADYLLSYTSYVADGSSMPLVTLRLVHAMSSVELHFVKPAGASDTRVTRASVKGVSYSASYSVGDHSADNISWTCTRTEKTTDYSRNSDYGFDVPDMPGADTYFTDGSLYFSFLTVQQPVDNIEIDVDFTVNGEPHTASFSLDSVAGVANWMAGTKTRYSIVLDREAHISGTVAQWNDGGEMEGTLVP